MILCLCLINIKRRLILILWILGGDVFIRIFLDFCEMGMLVLFIVMILIE